MRFDILVTNGTLSDGRRADIGIAGGRIEAIAPKIDAGARETVDASGCLVSPPFVDVHFHMDATLSLGIPRLNRSGTLLDDIYAAKEGSSRVLTQFIVNLVTGEPIRLVDGGRQKRCFTWVEDGIDLLMRIIENPGGVCDGEIFNVGNPWNECSVLDLAKKLAAIHDAHRDTRPGFVPARLEEVSSDDYFGKGYQDMVARKPSIKKAQRLLGWNPETTLDEALERTYEAFLDDWQRTGALA